VAHSIWPAVSKTFAFCSFTEKQKICWSQLFLNIAAMLFLLFNTCSGNILVCERHEKNYAEFLLIYIYFSHAVKLLYFLDYQVKLIPYSIKTCLPTLPARIITCFFMQGILALIFSFLSSHYILKHYVQGYASRE
jgi:hypothetical protein